MTAFSYERIRDLATTKGYHYRVRDAADNRIATCYVEANAQFIVDRLNGMEEVVAAERERWAKYADEKSASMDAFTRRARGNVVKPNEWDVLAKALREDR